MKRLSIFLVFLFIILTSVSMITAQELDTQQQTIGTFEQSKCINLIQTCSNCSYINITTVLYPNSSIVSINKEMTQTGTFYNYTWCDTSQMGSYIINGNHDLDGLAGIWSYDMKINGYGVELTTKDGLFYIFVFFILFFILCITIYGAWIFPFSNDFDP